MTVSSAISALSPYHWYKLDEASGKVFVDSGSGSINGTSTFDLADYQYATSGGPPDGGGFAHFSGSMDSGISIMSTWSGNGYQVARSNYDTTFILFFRFDVSNGGTTSHCLFNNQNWNDLNGSRGWCLNVHNETLSNLNSYKPVLDYYQSNGTAGQYWEDIFDLPDGASFGTEWHMLVVKKGAGTTRANKIYLNNILIAETRYYYALATTGVPMSNRELGYHSYSGGGSKRWFDGTMAHCAYWTSTLTDSQINTIWEPFRDGGGGFGTSATIDVVLYADGGPYANQSGLYWWFFANTTPSSIAGSRIAPVASGSGATTDSNGTFSVTTIKGVGITAGQTGYLYVTNSSGVEASQSRAGAVPVLLS